MDGTKNGAMQWSRCDIRPDRHITYKCNEARKARETLYILITSAMKQTRPERLYKIYYECNEASKTRVTLYISICFLISWYRIL